MKKKGFTLIELLAVIVILAIIALIATPLVLKYIEKSRIESKSDSAYSFVRNLETEIANYSIKKNGVKYKAPTTTNDFLTQDDLNASELNLKVKGENPGNIKVCLTSNGLVEKGMFEYGKYYVLYDGKKATASDKATFDIFTCSSNIGSGNGTGNGGAGGETGNGDNGNQSVSYLYESNSALEFAYDSEDGYYAMDAIDKSVFDKFEHGKEYELIIDDKTSIKVFCINNNGTYLITSDYSFDSENFVAVFLTDSLIGFSAFSELLKGSHSIKIKSSLDTNNVSAFVVYEGNNSDHNNAVGDTVALASTNFVDGNAHIIIKDNSGQTYFDGNVDLNDNNDGIFGVDSGCRDNFGYVEGIYTAVSNGKKIIITVIQQIDGKEKTTTINADNFIDYSGGKLFGRTVLLMNSGC